MSPEIVVRVAGEADGPILSEIERRSPLGLGDGAITIDRGDDYFAASRLMNAATVMLADVVGVPAGALCGAVHSVLLGGVERRMLYVHHARILPEFQRRGVGRVLASRLREHFGPAGFDAEYWYIAPGNATSQAFVRAAPNRWSFGPAWVSLSCEELAGPPHGRPATAADAGTIVDILNACHADEEMFLPYTAESFTARLARDPGQYGWERVWIADGAVAGVWPEGESIATRFTDPEGNVSVSRTGAVLDFGFLPGAEHELVALLRAWCAWLFERGMTELSLFTSAGTRSWATVSGLGGECRLFDFWTPQLPEPEGAAGRGLYVDHIYF
ncbi:MAG: GNAT family N-acetyltransferase [Chloroflexi bacterium]|nr:GNAT family N-acetyltransferase [Chloroflexota bacterium]